MTRQMRPVIIGLAQPQNSNAPQIVGMANGASQNSNGLVAGGGMPGYVTKMTSPARQQVIPAGETFTSTTGNLKTAATPENVSRNQNMIQGYDLLKPQLQQLAQDAPTYLSMNGELGKLKGDEIFSKIGQYFNPGGVVTDIAHALGLNPSEYSAYHRFKTIIPNAIDNYMAARGLPSTDLNKAMVQSILEPAKGELGDAYAKRMQYELQQMQNYKNIAQQNLSKGFDLTPTSPGYSENENNSKVQSSPGNVQNPSGQQNSNLNPVQGTQKVKTSLSSADIKTLNGLNLNGQESNFLMSGQPIKKGNTWWRINNGQLEHSK